VYGFCIKAAGAPDIVYDCQKVTVNANVDDGSKDEDSTQFEVTDCHYDGEYETTFEVTDLVCEDGSAWTEEAGSYT